MGSLPRRQRVAAYAVILREDRILLARRPEGGRMAGLWELPVIEPSGAERLHPARWQ